MRPSVLRVPRGVLLGSLWSKGPGGLNGGTVLRKTCNNDVIWALARPAQQLLTVNDVVCELVRVCCGEGVSN